jgi:hypothetical protein
VNFKLAILSVLARRPGGRASLDDLKDEVEALTADDDQSEEIATALDDIDIFQLGLVAPEGDGLRITDAGRSALRALEASSAPSFDLPAPSPSPALKMIDHLIGSDERLKIFDLELRGDEIELDSEGAEVGDAAPTPAVPVVAAEAQPAVRPEDIRPARSQETDDTYLHSNEATAIGSAPARAPDAPLILVRDGFSSGIEAPGGALSRRSRAFELIAARLQQALAIWRRHLERDTPNSIAGKRTGNVGGGALHSSPCSCS